MRFQDLRHTCATLLLTKGVHPKVVSEMLGHANISITVDTYSHVIPGLGDAAAHEVKQHSPSTLGTAFDVAENLLQNVYILPEKASRLARRGSSKPRQ